MSTRVYLGHLSRDASDKDVEDLFRKYGRIREVTIKNGFGFIEFGDARDAKDAVYDIHGKSFMGERLVVELARGERRREDRRDDRFGPPERTEHRLIVENLAHGVSWQDIKDLMRKAGEVTFADLSKDFDDQGVVEFATEDDMRYALKSLDGKELRGKPITLRLAEEGVEEVAIAIMAGTVIVGTVISIGTDATVAGLGLAVLGVAVQAVATVAGTDAARAAATMAEVAVWTVTANAAGVVVTPDLALAAATERLLVD
ncbi:serine arginine-rich splicing factor [Mortierella alpina]|nr:serine arginine-rich splicing factor [Mortierella alpina]